jgi:2-polyprenyl-3-methyl-5-hydroxy-6-metoxy-1,4-benzoquinol methylase
MTLETLKQCPVCSGSQFVPYLKVKDHTVSGEEFSIVSCKQCGFLFTNPRPVAAHIGRYYQSADYISHHDEAQDLMSRIYNKVREHTTRKKLKLINKLVARKGDLLDMGCGTGYFLSKAKADGWWIAGTEPDEQARSVAWSRVGDNVFEGIAHPFFENKSYDVITLWHVMEHIHQLNETVEWLHDHLNSRGKLIVAVPNAESDDARKYQENWAAYDVPRHLYHFSKKSMTELAQRHGFTLERIMPMWFDAYYVGLLSTRYQRGKSHLPISFWNGTVSNWKGRPWRRPAPNTSSLIYILSKK